MDQVTFPQDFDKYQALIELWNSTNALGMGFYNSHQQPTVDDAKIEIDRNSYVDYFFGKPIKCDFKNYPILESWSYDRDAGEGTMQKVADGCATFVGPSKELTEEEKKELLEKTGAEIQIRK